MATEAHCAFCFDVLSANLERSKPLGLAQLERLWKQFNSVEKDPQTLAEDPQEDPSQGVFDVEQPAQSVSVVDGNSNAAASGISRRNLAPSTESSSSTPSLMSTTSSVQTNESSTSTPSSTSSVSSGNHNQDTDHVSRIRQEDHPMFVTWNTISRSGNKSLRGCIGTFDPQELEHGLKTYALTSAFEDTRFPPITIRELPTLECSVTLLTDFETVHDPMDWDIGKHGLRISFTHHSKRYGATYLPDVAREQGWTKVETIISLMRKAGWGGRREEWDRVTDLNVVRYQGRKTSISHEDWKHFKDWTILHDVRPKLTNLERLNRMLPS